jgi:hypothetical protein
MTERYVFIAGDETLGEYYIDILREMLVKTLPVKPEDAPDEVKRRISHLSKVATSMHCAASRRNMEVLSEKEIDALLSEIDRAESAGGKGD